MKNVSVMLSSYWVLFWALNGVDKFCHRMDFGLFVWHGKDRQEQFGNYFSNMNLPFEWIDALLSTMGVLEILVAAILAYGLFTLKRDRVWLERGVLLSGGAFVAFCVFDVIAGDRAELLEHSTYLILVAITYAVSFHEFSVPKIVRPAKGMNTSSFGLGAVMPPQLLDYQRSSDQLPVPQFEREDRLERT